MAAGENTVASQGRYYHDKKAFIHTQVRLLEAPIQLPSDWKRHSQHRTTQEGTRDSIPDNVVSTALSKLHATSRKASRLTFNNQSIRQLLEQLEANQYELRRKARRGGIVIRTKPVQEVLETDWIDMFPETWQQEDGRSSATGTDPSSSSSAARTPATKQQKYADLRSRIVTLQKKYQSLKDKHEHYKALQLEVRRLHTGEIQQNILSPDSQVIQELEKMKVQRKHFRMNGDLYVVAVGLSMESH
ncbi:hypothetical protein BGX34_011141 [Mortierella sp. NVP85]|nr:hypothetical protein BGX34_011141 [Mortierella sp. NVP85]